MNNDLFVDKAILQLKLLKSVNLLDPNYESEGYICPICKKIFVGNEVKDLTQEDAPQDKLGGKRIALTCKDCNNTCGHEIDCYLINKIENFENSLFIPGTTREVRVKVDNREFNGILEIDQDGIAVMKHSFKQNDPRLLDAYLEKLQTDTKVFSKNKLRKTDEIRASVAILKNAFIILFSRLGYIAILDKVYDRIREQIIKPTELVVPILWKTAYKLPLNDGVYLIEDNIGFLIVYSIKKNFEYRVMVTLPTPKSTYEDVVRYLETIGPDKAMKLTPIEDLDYWKEIEPIRKIYEKIHC